MKSQIFCFKYFLSVIVTFVFKRIKEEIIPISKTIKIQPLGRKSNSFHEEYRSQSMYYLILICDLLKMPSALWHKNINRCTVTNDINE